MKENTMKPRRIHRPRGNNWQGKSGDTAALSQAKQRSHVSPPVHHNKPFAGKVFYLDLPSSRTAETLERDIRQLGGTVEKFFSKEIKYLVTNKREARYVQRLGLDSPIPSPDSGPSSPHPRSNPHRPGSHGDSVKSRSQGQVETFVSSRGKSLVERVVKEQERIQMNKILSNALEWGVKILYIDDVIAHVQRRKKLMSCPRPETPAVKTNVKSGSSAKQGFHKSKAGRLHKPFVKVEDSSRHYRPFYLTMANMPEFNWKCVPPCSPFHGEDKCSPGNKQEGKRDAKASATEERAHGRKKRDKKRGGYCECCNIKYENLQMHLQSECHKRFSKSDEYLVVDRQVSALQCNFIPIKATAKRRNCSISSLLAAPGPCVNTEPRHRGHLSSTETLKAEQQQTVNIESYSGHAAKTRSVPVSVPPAVHKDRRNCDTSAELSKPKAVARKRPCRQNSSTSRSQKNEDSQILELTKQTASTGGEGLLSLPSESTRVDSVDQTSHQDANRTPRIELNVPKEEEADLNKDSLETVLDGNAAPDGGTVKDPTLNSEVSTQSFSPPRKINRRVRVYKRKRRKVDSRAERTKPVIAFHGSILRLWEIFQSSDEMDVEFHGFED